MPAYRYSIYPADFVLSTPATHTIRQMDGHTFNPNPVKSPYTPGGGLDRAHVGLVNASPMHTFNTLDLETIFVDMAVSPIAGLDIEGIAPAAVWRYQERLCQGGFDTTATHIAINSNAGFLKPGTLSASAGDTDGASVSMDFYSISTDGLTAPDTKADAVNFSGVSAPTFESRYFFGPIYYNSSKLEGMDSVSIDFGIACEAKHFDFVYPQCVTITRRDPTITFTGNNMAIDAALNLFVNDAAGAFAIYFRKGVHGQSRVPVGTASHIKITAATGEWSVDSNSVSRTDDGQISVTVMPTGTITVGESAIP